MSDHLTEGSERRNPSTPRDSALAIAPNLHAEIFDNEVDALLMSGVALNEPERVKLALSQGADPMRGRGRALSLAAFAGNMELLKILLPLTDVASTGHSDFISAVSWSEDVEVVSLLATRADQRVLDEALCSACSATSSRPPRFISALIDAGANPKAHASRALALSLICRRDDLSKILFPLSDPTSWREGDMTLGDGHPWGALRDVAIGASTEGLAAALKMASPPSNYLWRCHPTPPPTDCLLSLAKSSWRMRLWWRLSFCSNLPKPPKRSALPLRASDLQGTPMPSQKKISWPLQSAGVDHVPAAPRPAAGTVSVRLAKRKPARIDIPAFPAARSNSPSTLEAITDDGSSLDARDPRGFTALHLACSAGSHGSVEQLILAGADINAEAADGSRPIESAFRHGHESCAALLRMSGAEPARASACSGDDPLPVMLFKMKSLFWAATAPGVLFQQRLAAAAERRELALSASSPRPAKPSPQI